MSKQRRTVSLEVEVDEYLGQDGVNASDLVNRLVRHHMEYGEGGGIRRLLLDDLRENAELLRTEYEMKQERIADLEDEIAEQQTNELLDEDATMHRARQYVPDKFLQSVPKEQQIPDVDSQELQSLAEKSTMAAVDIHERLVAEALNDD